MGAGHIFLSYNSADQPFADELVRALESHGLRIWYAPRDVRPGLDYSEQIQKAIETAAAFIVIVSEAANRSNFVRAETEMAFSRRRPIFPVRTSPVVPAPGLALFLQLRHWTDMFGPGRQSALNRLSDELVAAGQAPAGTRRAGPTLFRPRLRRGTQASPPTTARSRAPLILILVGAGALILAFVLAIPSGTQAELNAGQTAATGNMAGNFASPLPGGPNYDPLADSWIRAPREEVPPPEDEVVDNGRAVEINTGMNMTAIESSPESTTEVNGM